MSTGGIFTIITNDGKQDRMLMATAFLHDRLASINKFKHSQNGGQLSDLSNLPTLLDIERTHVLFTNAHFKPFVAIGFEYNKVRAVSGNPSLGQPIQFSVPQFGDFFHDVVCHVVLTQPTLTSTASLVDDGPAMRWCAFPGERLLQTVQQEVNGNYLDEYNAHDTNFYREYRVAPNKRLGWDRCLGQEVPQDGFLRQNNWASNGANPMSHRVGSSVYNGNQTPSGQKSGSLEMFIPLLFWYCTDVRLAVPSVAIPYGQRFINIRLASANQLVGVVPRGSGTWASPNGSVSDPTVSTVELYINNIFCNPEVHKIYIKRIGFSLIRVHKFQSYNANTSTADVLLQQLKWPIEYLFVGMKLQDYHNSSSAADRLRYLDRWHKFSYATDNTYLSTGQNVSRLSSLVSTAGTVSISTGGALTLPAGTWTQAVAINDVLEVNGVRYAALSAATAGSSTAITVNPAPATAVATAASANCFKVLSQGLEVQTTSYVPTIDSITIQAHGINIYNNFPSGFFTSYTSYHYGGPNINTPEDIGCLFIPFCLYPGTYQPSGHINISRAREFYLTYTSSVINGSTIGNLIVCAVALNFLLISDGSAVLRYST